MSTLKVILLGVAVWCAFVQAVNISLLVHGRVRTVSLLPGLFAVILGMLVILL